MKKYIIWMIGKRMYQLVELTLDGIYVLSEGNTIIELVLKAVQIGKTPVVYVGSKNVFMQAIQQGINEYYN